MRSLTILASRRGKSKYGFKIAGENLNSLKIRISFEEEITGLLSEKEISREKSKQHDIRMKMKVKYIDIRMKAKKENKLGSTADGECTDLNGNQIFDDGANDDDDMVMT